MFGQCIRYADSKIFADHAKDSERLGTSKIYVEF